MTELRLLMVDDEPGVGDFVCQVAKAVGFDTRYTGDTEHFAQLYRSFRPDVLILDLSMPNVDGIELLQLLADEKSGAGILLMSGIDAKVRKVAFRLGEAHGLNMMGLVPKPVRAAELRHLLTDLRDQLTAAPER